MKAFFIWLLAGIASLFGFSHLQQSVPPQATHTQTVLEMAAHACEGKQLKDSCTATLDGKALPGTCQQLNASTTGCVPNGGANPLEIVTPSAPTSTVTACQDKQLNDSCTATLDGKDLPGTCEQINASTTACAPIAATSTPTTTTPTAAVTACQDKQLKASCTVELGGTQLSGTCQSVVGGQVACAPAGDSHGTLQKR